ncbi:MAG: hypothetical protein WA966_02480 [Ornithinimicrobium sp.]
MKQRHGRGPAQMLLDGVRARFEQTTSMFATELLASTAHDNGDLVVIYRDELGVVRGMTWNVFAVRREFSPMTYEDLGEVLFRELDEPSDRGLVDVDRARGLVDDPQTVGWLNRA